MKLHITDRITICGMPGTGKTVLSQHLASLWEPNVLIYDPLAQYENFPNECRYVPKSDSLTEFDAVCRRLCARSNVMFVVEECERYIGQGKMLGSHAFELINRGRNWGVGLTAVTRRIQRLSKDYFDLCRHVFFFKCGLKSRGYIAELVGKEEALTVIRLPRYYFLHYDLEEEKSEVVKLKLMPTPRLEPLVEKTEEEETEQDE